MKRNTAQSNNIAQDLPSIKNLESPPAAALPAAQWQQYAEAASRFAAEWAHEMDEKGEAHSFWDEFLQIFQIRRRQLTPLGFARHEARADNRRSSLRFLDPVCGCGNFLVVTYRELHLLDHEVVRAIRLRTGQLVTNTDKLNKVWQTQFNGLEIKSVSRLLAKPSDRNDRQSLN